MRAWRPGNARRCLRWLVCGALGAVTVGAQAQPAPPTRAADLRYGEVLYEYHQGEAFRALTLLSVAASRGGIQGHGDHPALVEGGLLLSYGMVNEAGRRFERLLSDEAPGVGVTPEVRNRAWFYLGKVQYLSGEPERAHASLQRVDSDRLAAGYPGLFQEWCYLRAELARRHPALGGVAEARRLADRLPQASLWRVYLEYNLALDDRKRGDGAGVESRLAALLPLLENGREADPDARERQALAARVRLSLSRMMTAERRFDDALAVLSALPQVGPLSDQGLYEYAVAAAQAGQHSRAFAALSALASRPGDSPWLQPVPYARAYLLEQTRQPRAALEAYRSAAAHYQEELARLASVRASLSETSILSGLTLERDSSGVLTDAYGRLKAHPDQTGLVALLATERFQRVLAQWQELRILARDLTRWQDKLETFDIMLATRKQQRQRRAAETRAALDALQADTWAERHRAFAQDIDAARASGDAAFFMSTRQKQLARRLASVASLLATLPDDARTTTQRRKYQRLRAYFEWQLADQYGINRWAAEKPLRELDAAMVEFAQRRQRVEALLATDDESDRLAARLDQLRERLSGLQAQLGQALAVSRAELIAQVDAELAGWLERNRAYLLASRHAQARLADALLMSGQPEGGQP